MNKKVNNANNNFCDFYVKISTLLLTLLISSIILANEISDKAKTCIHCGYPISLETRKKVKKKEWNELTTEEKQSIMAYRKKIGQSPVVSAIIIALAFLFHPVEASLFQWNEHLPPHNQLVLTFRICPLNETAAAGKTI